jgi:Tol biopolymer transport system component
MGQDGVVVHVGQIRLMLRLLSIVTFAAVLGLMLAGPGAATFPGHDGRIVFASARPDRPGEGNSEIYELDVATGLQRDISRTTAYDDSGLAVSPDGTRIAFARAPIRNPDADPNVHFAPPPRLQLWVMSRDGSDQHRLDNLDFYAVSTIAWSSDEREIAFLAESAANTASHLWVVGADGSGLRELTNFPTLGPSWSPDGSDVVFMGWNDPAWRIGFIAPDGGGLRWLPTSLTAVISAGTAPAWSPDGKELAFVGVAASSAEVLTVVNADGSGARTLASGGLLSDLRWLPSGAIGFLVRPITKSLETRGKVELIRPDGSGLRLVADHVLPPVIWAPAGGQLAFAPPSSPRELVIASAGGSRRVLSLPGLLARPGNGLAGGPAWSSSGASIYVAGTVTPSDTEIYSITPQGGDLRQLTRNALNDVDPVWSPDGQRIAFVRETTDRRGYVLTSLWVMAAGGSNKRRLTRPGSDSSPSWAPDNVHLAFVRQIGRITEIAVVDTRTRRVRVLASNVGTDPAWSPDGRVIAVVSSSLRLIRPDGSVAVHSLFDRSDLERGTRFWPMLQPSWSPDGQQIAFTTFFYGKLSSYEERQLVVPRTGGVPRELSCGPSSPPPGSVRWSPDSSALVSSGGGEVWVCPLDGSPAYRLTDGVEPDWQPLS